MQHSSWMNQRSLVAALVCAGCAIGGAGCGPLEEEDLSAAEIAGTTAEALTYQSATWVNLAQMSVGRAYHAATLLPNGKLLVVGGQLAYSSSVPASAELLDPATLTWSPAAPAIYHHKFATANLLADGRVLVAGDADPQGSLAVELYDPAANTWSSVPFPGSSRAQYATVRLSDGRVLLAGGSASSTSSHSSAYLFDPTTDSWSPIAPMNQDRRAFSLILLQDGRVLAAGGKGLQVYDVDLASAEIFDPQTGTWTLTTSMAAARSNYAGALLEDGRVLAAGSIANPKHAEIFDPVTETWSSTAPLASPRTTAVGLMLANGQVLLAGGSGDGGTYMSQLYDPVADHWTLLDAMNTGHVWHTLTRLPCGEVVVTGTASGLMRHRSVEMLPAVDDTVCARAGGSTEQ